MSDVPERAAKYDAEEVASVDSITVYEDKSDDYWLEKNGDLILLTASDGRGSLSDAFEALEEAGALPPEYTTKPDPSPSPEDVAETWIKAGYGGSVKYGPLSALNTGTDALTARLNPAYNPDGTEYGATKGFGASRFETVDAADVPFSEVPTDD